MIDPHKRYQKHLNISDLFIQTDDTVCACGCGNKLKGRQKRWASKQCNYKSLIQFYIIKGDSAVIRQELYKRDEGFCYCCGEQTEDWEADHIKPVFLGGGGCDLTNYQTLCKSCHQLKSAFMVSHKFEISEAVYSNRSNLLLKDFLDDEMFPVGTSILKQYLGLRLG